MRFVIVRCGPLAAQKKLPEALHNSDGVAIYDMPAVPGRKDLRVLDAEAHAILPDDPTASLEEIQASPSVSHLGAPQFAPQQPPLDLRVIVMGSDAALSAVVTRLMRIDQMWVHVGFIAVDDSPDPSRVARLWGLPDSFPEQLQVALTAPVRPIPLIRNDAGIAVLGSAAIADWNDGPITAEIIVDDSVLVFQDGAQTDSTRRQDPTVFAALLSPTTTAPGIAARQSFNPLSVDSDGGRDSDNGSGSQKPWWKAPWSKLKRGRGRGRAQQWEPWVLFSGRAVQAGGTDLAVIVDGITAPRPRERVTFYRHLRDVQAVRPAS